MIFKRTIKKLTEQEIKGVLLQTNNDLFDNENNVLPTKTVEYDEILKQKNTFNIQFFLTQNIKDIGIYNDIEK